MICSVRSATCQTVKATAMTTVAASAHHSVAGRLAGFLVASGALLDSGVLLVSRPLLDSGVLLDSGPWLVSGPLLVASRASGVSRASRKAGQAAGSWRTAK